MTKIKLVDGTIINADSVKLINGALKISTTECTVEELAEVFSDNEKTARIVLMTESGIETGYKEGFTSFSGIAYDAEGVKTIELFQPADVTEQRVANAESTANLANEKVDELGNTVDALLGTGGDTDE